MSIYTRRCVRCLSYPTLVHFAPSGDGGLAVSARLNGPVGVAPNGLGGLFVADTYNHAIRFVDSGGIITTVVGALGLSGFSGLISCSTLYVFLLTNVESRVLFVVKCLLLLPSSFVFSSPWIGDGGPATSSRLTAPLTVLFEPPLGGLFVSARELLALRPPPRPSWRSYLIMFVLVKSLRQISLQGGSRIRYVSPLRVISTVAGSGSAALSGDGGLASSSSLSNPSLCSTGDGLGGWLIADANNFVVRRIAFILPDVPFAVYVHRHYLK